MAHISRCLMTAFALSLSPLLWATPVETDYREPPAEVTALVDMLPPVDGVPSPDGGSILLLERPALPGLVDLAASEQRLAGLRFNPDNHSPSNPRYYAGLSLQTLDGQERSVRDLPQPLRILEAAWSPDARSIAFLQIEDDAVQLWRIEVDSGQAQRWTSQPVHAAWGRGWGPFERTYMAWAPDSESVVFRTLPSERGAAPQRDRLPSGPIVTETRARLAPTRTFQDLLSDAHDERLFNHYFSTQLVRVHLDGRVDSLGQPGLMPAFSLSPEGEHLLITRLLPPFSYAVPFSRFAHAFEVWTVDGKFQTLIAENGLADDLPIAFDAVIDGRRSVGWRADADATLVWVEAADGGEPARESEVRDRLFQQAAPFTAEPELLLESAFRVNWVLAGDEETALVWQRWWDSRMERVDRISPGDAGREPRMLWERAFEDSYADPGLPMTGIDERGQRRLLLDDHSIFLAGEGASPAGNRPFVDRLDLESLDSERLWQSTSPHYERALAMLDVGQGRVLTQREAVNEPPDFYVRNLFNGGIRALTRTDHPLPEIMGVSRELITYERDDGVTLSATLLLPAGFEAERDGALPTVIWAYPREFLSADAAGQLADSPYRFNRLSYWSAQWLVTQGYAVFDNATMPVIGADGVEPNDRFIEQISMNARAAIDEGVRRGVTDPQRVAIGGHSYGAFMTASLLAHTDLFRAGIARSGAYNRTLTPFGFQREQRTLWDDTDLYVNVSPFFHAHRMQAPVLIIHGTEDNNSGTYPMQSERLYQAVRGLGGTARLVMLPLESHGYRARESVLHMLFETIAWLDEHLATSEEES